MFSYGQDQRRICETCETHEDQGSGPELRTIAGGPCFEPPAMVPFLLCGLLLELWLR